MPHVPQYRNMIKFRHLNTNELGHDVPPPRRRTGARAAATRGSPAPPPTAAASSQHTAGASAAAGTRTRSTASHAQPVLTEAQQQAQLAAAQMAAQARLGLANTAIKQAQQGYVQALAAACVWQGAAGAAMESAAAAAAAGAEDAPAQMAAAQQLAQQAAAVQGLLQAARSVYQGAAEEAQAAQLAANAAVAAMLQAAESAADSAVLGLRPGSAQGPADSGAGVPLRSSNRRKAALNRKRFTGEGQAALLWRSLLPLVRAVVSWGSAASTGTWALLPGLFGCQAAAACSNCAPASAACFACLMSFSAARPNPRLQPRFPCTALYLQRTRWSPRRRPPTCGRPQRRARARAARRQQPWSWTSTATRAAARPAATASGARWARRSGCTRTRALVRRSAVSLEVLLLQGRYAWGQMAGALAHLGWLAAVLLRWGSVGLAAACKEPQLLLQPVLLHCMKA